MKPRNLNYRAKVRARKKIAKYQLLLQQQAQKSMCRSVYRIVRRSTNSSWNNINIAQARVTISQSIYPWPLLSNLFPARILISK